MDHSIKRSTMPQLSNSLIHWPQQPPAELLDTYDNRISKQLKKPSLCANTTVIAPKLMDSIVMQTSTKGQVPNGLPDSRGFIVRETTYGAMSKQPLAEATLDAWNKTRPEVLSRILTRQKLLDRPLATPSPDQWLTTTQREHVNLLPALVQDTKDHIIKDPQPRTHRRFKPDSAEVSAAKYTRQFRSRDAAIRDVAGLKDTLSSEQRMGMTVSRNGNTLKDSNRAIQTKLKPMDVAPLSTTYGVSYSAPDPIVYVDSNQAPRLEVTSDEEAHIVSKLNSPRHVGIYATTYADSYADVSGANEVDPTFRKSHHFDKIQNTRQMPRHVPLELTLSRNNFQHTKSAAEIVPHQYVPASTPTSTYIAAVPTSPVKVEG